MNKLISILSTCLLASVVCADPVTVPNTFSAGTPAKASEVNANFTALANAVNDAPKPLMVYDSTDKLVGSLIKGDENTILISSGGIKFFAEFFEGIKGSCSYVEVTCNLGERYIKWRQYALKYPLINLLNNLYYESADCSGQEYFKSSSFAGDESSGNNVTSPFNHSVSFYHSTPSGASSDGDVIAADPYSPHELVYMKIYSGTIQLLYPRSYKDNRYQICRPYPDASPYMLGYKVIKTVPASEFNFIPPLSIR